MHYSIEDLVKVKFRTRFCIESDTEHVYVWLERKSGWTSWVYKIVQKDNSVETTLFRNDRYFVNIFTKVLDNVLYIITNGDRDEAICFRLDKKIIVKDILTGQPSIAKT